MKLIKQTDEYIVYLKRSGRYGVKNTDHEWINGISKTRILLAEGLIETTLPPEPDVDAGEAADDTEVAATPDIVVAEEDSSIPPEPDVDAGEAADDTEVAATPDIVVAEEDSSIDDALGSIDSEAEEPEIEEAANPQEESSGATEAEDSVPETTANASDEEDSETSTASDSPDDVANADTTDEEEPEAIEDKEGKEP